MKRRNELVKYLNTNRSSMNSALDGFKNLMDAKVMIINKLTKIKSVGTFLEEENGLSTLTLKDLLLLKMGQHSNLSIDWNFPEQTLQAAKDWG